MQYINYLSALLLLVLISCDPFNTKIEDQKIQVIQYEATDLTSAPTIDSLLKVATWNVKFGGGRIDFFFDCHGDRVLMNKNEVLENSQTIITGNLYKEQDEKNTKRNYYLLDNFKVKKFVSSILSSSFSERSNI